MKKYIDLRRIKVGYSPRFASSSGGGGGGGGRGEGERAKFQLINAVSSAYPLSHCNDQCTVRKMDLILRPIERRPQMQFSMARRFKLQLLRRYSVKFSKMHNFTLETLRLDKLKSTGGGEPTSLGSTVHDSTTAPPVHM